MDEFQISRGSKRIAVIISTQTRPLFQVALAFHKEYVLLFDLSLTLKTAWLAWTRQRSCDLAIRLLPRYPLTQV
jgi:DNA-binding transcriptional LysR family regulator